MHGARGQLRVDGHANFLTEPFAGLRTEVELEKVPLQRLKPVAAHANVGFRAKRTFFVEHESDKLVATTGREPRHKTGQARKAPSSLHARHSLIVRLAQLIGSNAIVG